MYALDACVCLTCVLCMHCYNGAILNIALPSKPIVIQHCNIHAN